MRLLLSLLVLTSLFACNTTTDNIPQTKVFQSNEERLAVKINGEVMDEGWNVNDKEKPLIFEVECTQKENHLILSDQKDSLSFKITLGETERFTLVKNNKDSILVKIVGVEPNFNFTEEYIAQHKGKTKVAIPEVSELANILIALHLSLIHI